jgi:hypothetical protein
MSKFFLVVASLLLAGAVHAEEQVVEKALVAQSLDGFHQEAGAIREGMKPGGRYEFVKAGDRDRIEARLSTMEAVLQKNATKNDLTTADKIALANAQEEVNGILKHNDSNRLVCESRAPIGSHLPVKTCRTFGEIEQQRRDAVRSVSEMDRSRVGTHGN